MTFSKANGRLFKRFNPFKVGKIWLCISVQDIMKLLGSSVKANIIMIRYDIFTVNKKILR